MSYSSKALPLKGRDYVLPGVFLLVYRVLGVKNEEGKSLGKLLFELVGNHFVREVPLDDFVGDAERQENHGIVVVVLDGIHWRNYYLLIIWRSKPIYYVKH